MQLKTPSRAAVVRGFTLIELLITLVVVSVGLLGLAKLQATAMAESQVSRTRALMTFQAETLAAAIRANRTIWGSTTTLQSFTVDTTGAVTSTTLGTWKAGGCEETVATPSNTCTPIQLANDDAKVWGQKFNAAFAGATTNAAVTCAAAAGAPASCDITLTWYEHYVAMNRTTAASGATTSAPISMVLHVQP